jgi:hypothetical protein
MIIPEALGSYFKVHAGCQSSGKKKARLTAGLSLFLDLRLSGVSRISEGFGVEIEAVSRCYAAEGEVDAERAGERVAAGGYRGDAVIDEACRSSPDQNVAVLDADAAWSVGPPKGAEEKCGG